MTTEACKARLVCSRIKSESLCTSTRPRTSPCRRLRAGRTLRPDQRYGDDVFIEETSRHEDLILLGACPPPLGLLKADVGVIDGRIALGLFHAVGKD